MNHLVLASLSVTTSFATGAVLFFLGADIGSAWTVQQILSPDTPIGGLTVGVAAAATAFGIGLMWQGAKQMLALGGYLRDLRTLLNESRAYAETLRDISQRVERLEGRMEAHDKWRSHADGVLSDLKSRLSQRDRGAG